ncbi:hypothetical protein AAGS61_10335 [Lysinibacillus sp. KU-BSD001]|uniref:hypothetical protein n=1 Tax=Lysinibacillus sp. KU-BSD001 TaxID=3141328 RepID=UPI0036E85150
MRKSTSITLILLFVIFLTACNEETSSTYVGENEDWLVQFDVVEKKSLYVNDNEIIGNYVATYKGDSSEGLENKEVLYEVGFEEFTSGGNASLNNEGVLKGTAFQTSCHLDCERGPELIFKVKVADKEENIKLNKE